MSAEDGGLASRRGEGGLDGIRIWRVRGGVGLVLEACSFTVFVHVFNHSVIKVALGGEYLIRQ